MWRKKYFFCSVFLLSSLFFSSCNDLQPITVQGVDSVKIIQADKNGISLEIGLHVKNPNSMSFTVYRSEVQAQLNGMALGNAHLMQQVKIPANSEGTTVLKVQSDFSKISLSDIIFLLPNIIAGKGIVSLKGDITAGKLFYKKTFPVDVSTPLNSGLFRNH